MAGERARPEAIAALLVAAGLAWWWTAGRMAGMDMGPGTDLGPFGWFAVSWLAMMAAMMLPSLGPSLAAAPGRGLPFAAGYLLAWTAAGLVAYEVFAAGKDLLGGDLAWSGAGRWLSAGVLLGAALYELLPVKAACLARCRGQLDRGTTVPLLTGLRSGGWCIGCSWALMAALFALGVMSLTWMALVAVLVAVEKLGPWPRAGRLVTAGVLAGLGAAILVAPDQLPGLTVPGS